jgi:hypothetical protein
MKWNNVKEENEALKEKATSVVSMRSEEGKGSGKSAGKKGSDLQSGLELLEMDFLLSVVENTAGNDTNDVTMRKINFNELLRREERHQVASSALKVYAIDEEGLYGKDIQCQAMQELAARTAQQHG